MSTLKERLTMLLHDPRVGRLMREPKVQELAVKALRWRGRIEGTFDQRVQRVANMLNLATQRDLRSLQRRIRHLERELREAEERLTDAEGSREAPVHS